MKKNRLPERQRPVRELLKFLLLMKIAFAITFLACLRVSAAGYSQDTRLTLNLKQAPITKLLKIIEKRSDLKFVYSNDYFPGKLLVDVHVKDAPVKEILSDALKNTGFTFKKIDNDLVVIVPESKADLLKDIHGKVTASNGDPLEGVTVSVAGGNAHDVTDAGGRYSINVTGNEEILIFSYVGYTTRRVTVGDRNEVNVVMTKDVTDLGEVVVVGYGTQTKKAVTGSVVSIGQDKFKDRSFSNVMQSLAGQVAGVNITQSQGAPGVSPVIRIRGINSITAGTNPLFVVDGVPLEDFNMNMINPQDIESVEVLKDASSAAIYGSRGSSGVILITTRMGKAGQTKVSANFDYGWQKVVRRVDMMDAQQWIDYYVTAKNNSWVDLGGGHSASDPNSVRTSTLYKIPEAFLTNPGQFGKGTDWQDVLYHTAPVRNAQVSVSGGTDKTQYLFSGGYLDQDAVLDNNYYKRLSLRSNIRQILSPKFTIGLNLGLTGIYDRTDGTEGKSDVIGLALQSDPIFPLYNENGNLGIIDPNSVWNEYLQYNPVNLWHPYATTRFTDKQNKAFNALGTAFIEYKILKGLRFRSSINGNVFNNRYSYYRYKNQGYGFNQSLNGSEATASSGYTINWLSENTLTYDKRFNDHAFTLLAGYTAQKQSSEFQSATATNFPNDLVHTLSAGSVTSGTSTISEWSMLSYLARINYNFRNRYFLTSTIRRDGSSRFGANHQWGYFPSVSAGWILSEENFMQARNAISLLKLRASYGVAGNNQIPNYGPISLLGASNYASGNTQQNGLNILSIPNPDLKWEKTTQLNLGLDVGLWDNRVSISAEYYNSLTRDMLLNVPVPDISGFSTQLTNIGKMRNRGFELIAHTKNLTGSFRWTTDLNFSLNRNRVLQLGPGNAPIIYSSNETSVKIEVGQPVSNYYGYVFEGVYKNQAEINKSVHESSTAPGDPIIKDVSGDNSIGTDDRTIIGNYQPDFSAGMVNTFSYKGVELSVMLQGSFGGEIVNQNYRFLGFMNSGRNLFASSYGFYRSEAEPGDGINPRPTITRKAYQSAFSTLWVEDASFIRIKNIRLAYTLPPVILKKLPLDNLSVYINADNVKLFSKYTGYDPENTTYKATSYSASGTDANTGTASSSMPSGVMIGFDYGSYPIPRVITIGIKADF